MSGSSGEMFGFKADVWEKGKREAICAIVRAGRKEALISYSDLSKQITSITVEPHSYAMDRLLDEISKEEDAAGRGILTALVVLKDERVPAEGFWASARDIGGVIGDKTAFWAGEVERVFAECKKHPLCP
jgi:hypothetical protein